MISRPVPTPATKAKDGSCFACGKVNSNLTVTFNYSIILPVVEPYL